MTEKTDAKTKTLYEIAILGQITWNLHSLNNEGSTGNVVEPRTVRLADGSTADGISGEMLKHIHADKIWEITKDKSQFCPACQRLEPMRADAPEAGIKADTADDAMQQAIKQCVLCDLHGFLIQRPTVSRQSTTEFGWAVGRLQSEVYRDIHQHARHAVGFRGEGRQSEVETTQQPQPPLDDADATTTNTQSEVTEDGNDRQATSQMLFHRPTRSGEYAFVTVLQPWRIGLNTVTYQYAIDSDTRFNRYQTALGAYEAMFLRMEGAMTSTRLPHLEGFNGVIVLSKSNYPAPVYSPLKDSYKEKLERLAQLKEDELEVKRFDDAIELVTILNELHGNKTHSLYSLAMPEREDDA